MSTVKYGVWCKVSGGRTGTREAWLKSYSKLVLFETEAEAEEKATAMQPRTVPHKDYTVVYEYSARIFA